MSKNDEEFTIRLGKKEKVDNPPPKEYRVFTLNTDLAANTKVNSVSFYTLQAGSSAPVFMKIVITVPTESVLPYSADPIPSPDNKRCFPIFVPTADICPTTGVNVFSSADSKVAGSTHTQLEIHLTSGGKVPGGVGFFSE
jgi:hypothetical protein